jgi:hypothetical protein
MRIATTFAIALTLTALPATAIDFLGVELCAGSIDTRVALPPGSSLVLQSAEIGDNGGLVLLLSARNGKVMDHVDDLMTGLTGKRGKGDGDFLEWSDGRLTGVAQKVAKKYAALAVTSTDDCTGDQPAPSTATGAAVTETPDAAAEPTTPTSPSTPNILPDPIVPAAAAATTATVVPEPAPEPAPVPAATPDFQVIGAITHEAADPTWVDVMGVVANNTATGYKLATFDLSFFATDGSLICVDTISVSVLKTGQERAFRDAIRCPGYSPDAVAETRLQFSGGF